MESFPKISIVIPVYKVEEFLSECVESVRNQTISDIEIILVDDGSPDKCPEICDCFVKKDTRIKVIHKNNEGLGMARNSGMEIAKGEYIGFVDSDDFVDSNFYEELYSVAKEKNADACLSGEKEQYSNKSITNIHPLAGHSFSGDEIQEKLLPTVLGYDASGNNYGGMSVWRGIYKTAVIKNNNIRFPSEKKLISEDVVFDLHIYRFCKRVAVCSIAGYHYRHRDGSLTTIYFPDRFDKYKTLWKYEIDQVQRYYHNSQLIMRIDSMFIANVRSLIKQLCSSSFPQKKKNEELHRLCRDQIVKTVLGRQNLNRLPYKQKLFNKAILHDNCFLIFLICYATMVIKKSLS